MTGIISTVAGRPNQAGFSGDGGIATNAQLYYPYGLAFDAGGNLFIADWYNYRIRRVDSAGIITTVVGNGGSNSNVLGDDGPALSANVMPIAITVDGGGSLFISDLLGNSVRKVDGQTGTISNIAGNHTVGSSGDGDPAITAALYNPVQMAIDRVGNLLFCDSWNDRIRKVMGVAVPVTNGPGTYLGPKITSAEIASGVVGIPFSYQITASNSPLSYTAVGLPAGLTLDSASGLIHGSPTEPGTAMVLITAINANGPGSAEVSLAIRDEHAPVVAQVSENTFEDTSLAGTLLATDAEGDPLTVTLQTPTSHGLLAHAGLSWTYTPQADWSGTDSGVLAVSDGYLTTLVPVTVVVQPVNDPPMASAVSAQTVANSALELVPVLADIDSSNVMPIVVSQPQHGMLTVVNGQLRYVPAENWIGTDTCSYAGDDGMATGAPALVTVTVVGSGLPVPWQKRDIGSPLSVSSATYGWGLADGQFTLSGVGTGIQAKSDQCSFVHQAATGDLSIIAKIDFVENTHANARGGLMIRDGLAANAKHVSLLVSPTGAVVFQRRTTTNGNSAGTSLGTRTQPWIRLQRVGNMFTAYLSTDGVTWGSARATLTLAMPTQVQVGLVSCSGKNNMTSRSEFRWVLLTPIAMAQSQVMAPWFGGLLGCASVSP